VDRTRDLFGVNEQRPESTTCDNTGKRPLTCDVSLLVSLDGSWCFAVSRGPDAAQARPPPSPSRPRQGLSEQRLKCQRSDSPKTTSVRSSGSSISTTRAGSSSRRRISTPFPVCHLVLYSSEEKHVHPFVVPSPGLAEGAADGGPFCSPPNYYGLGGSRGLSTYGG
jgi:hypothetical protein